jgi:hypothetical protein
MRIICSYVVANPMWGLESPYPTHSSGPPPPKNTFSVMSEEEEEGRRGRKGEKGGESRK